MIGHLRNLGRAVMHLTGDRGGAAAMIYALMMTALMASTAVVVDYGNVVTSERKLQATVNAAALAGATAINCCATAGQGQTTAVSYSAASGGSNASSGMTVTTVAGYPKLKCLASIPVPCNGVDSANAIQIRQTATINSLFARFIGIQSFTITSQATAARAAGGSKPLDVMLVIDTTASMNNADAHCSVAGATRLACAQAGARALLTAVAPSVNYVGLMTFPGVKNAAEALKDTNCGSASPVIVNYKSSPLYLITGLASDYRTSDTVTTLNPASNMVKAMKGAGITCSYGIKAPGGVGTYYADVITAAQAELVANGRANTQRVIILLSDGDAGASSTNMATAKYNNQCAQAVTAAAAAKTAGTWVYTIAYGASTSATGSCPTDLPRISACTTMAQIATDSPKFFSDGVGTGACLSGSNSVNELVGIFTQIGQSFKTARLVPDGMT